MRPIPIVMWSLAGALVAGDAVAGDITTITVTDAGPDKTIPTDAPFYLAGSAKGASRVQVFVVRTGSPSLFGSDPVSCRAVDAKLGKLKVMLADLKTNRTTADTIWVGGDPDWSVALPPAWTPPAATPSNPTPSSDFKILVDHDDFFSAGHGYCFYIYEDTPKPDFALANAVLEAVASVPTCPKDGPCTLDHSAIDKLIKAIPDATTRKNVDKAVNDSLHLASSMTQAATDAYSVLNDWATKSVKPYALPAEVTGALATATIALLSANDKLLPRLAPTLQAHTTPNGTVDLKLGDERLTFLATGQVRVIGASSTAKPVAKGAPPVPYATQALDVKTSALAIPDAPSSLEDVLQFAQGRLPLEKSYVSPGDYWRRLAPALRKYDGALDADQTALVASAQTSLHALRTTLDLIHQAAKPTDPDDGSKAAILWQFHQWLVSTEVKCDPKAFTCDDKKDGWDSYVALNKMPLDRLDEALKAFAENQSKWIASRPSIETATASTLGHAIPAEIQYTRDTWFFSYVSPVVGYALASPKRDNVHEGVTVLYYGVDIHVVPNPDHQPVHGAGRFAFELGGSPGIGSFGPDNRYRGWGNISPVFVGFGVHLIPYTTLTVGAMIAERRTSTVTQESYKPFAAGFIGLSVDANIPELVRSSMGKSSTTTSSPTTK